MSNLGGSVMISNSRFRNILYPSLFAMILVLFWVFFVKKTTFDGLSSVLESIITFSSIIMQSELINITSMAGNLVFYVWLFSTFMPFIVSGITMSFLIRLIFAKQVKPREQTKI
ncbi:hypothetical protein [Leuconostoc pseudomesenteroides]|uniref:hypothetical protein n=1 Tax=Leuconostoc pseudomesenteroides TaxID=33968 RepID=UPI0022857DC0|nr:hypothetical protein [Leuconostoc pseudomesenteroides]WAM38243.1 hypothetical protein OYT93_08535 [Leuconostoc pseudomesenteroides]